MPTRRTATITRHMSGKGTTRKLNPYPKFVKTHIKTATGATQQAKMRAVAAMWHKKH